ENGYYHYFQTLNSEWGREPNTVLSAYTLKSFRYLASLGYSIQKEDIESLEEILGKDIARAGSLGFKSDDSSAWERFATSAGAIEKPEKLDSDALTNIWTHWDKLSWFARSELLLAMSQKPELKEQTRQGIERLQAAGKRHGLRQVIHDERDFSFYMGSDLRDQCAVVGALSRLDHLTEDKTARERLLRGIYDIYAGGTASLDTQSSAQCLMALHEASKATGADKKEISLNVGLENKGQPIAMTASMQTLNWQSPVTSQHTSLQISSNDNAGGSLNYNATLEYEFDLLQSIAKGTGLNLERSYDVLRGDKWLPVEGGAVKEGDWIRVRLLINAPKERYFVAVSDFAPGGFVTRDITLSSVGGANAEKIGGNGSYYFDSRQTGASVVRIYAEYLPAGRHEVYYYAQAVHPGNYFAPPAIAELMYGRASRANTSAERVTVQASK
ncbi:MAG: hypothetical protein ACRERV_07730, partial [Methylococcales bacterium]